MQTEASEFALARAHCQLSLELLDDIVPASRLARPLGALITVLNTTMPVTKPDAVAAWDDHKDMDII